MSFTDDFMSELDKKKKKKKKNSSSTSGTSATGGKSYSEKFMDALGDDISPMPSPTMASIHKYGEDDIAPVKGGDKDSWFKSGGFSDGVDSVGDFFGDLGQTVLGTAGDLAWDVAKGAGRMVEGLVDLGTYGVASVADKLGADEFAEKARDVAKYSATDEWTKDITDFVDRYSVLGNKADMIGEGLGQVGTIILTGGVAASAGLGAGGVAAVTTGATGLSSMGTGMGEAYNSGATDEEAFWYGLGSGAIEAGTELLFGGLGKSVQALGISRGIGGLDEIFAKKLSSKIAGSIANESVQKLLGNTIEFGVKSAGEGLEEVLSGFGSAVMKKLTYMEDEELSKLVKDENLLEQFVVGTITSSIVQGGDFVKATKSGTDFVTGHTAADEKVINKVVEEEVAKREAAGEKLTTKDKNKIYDSVVDLMEKGQIDIDTIESVLGGDTYKAYKETVDSEDALKNELAELRKMKSGDMNDLQTERMNELKGMNLDDTTKRDGLRKNLDDMLSPMLKVSKLSESYRERERRGQAFEADLSKYTGKKREAVERAVKSGVLNNTYRSHELVDVLSEIEATKGISFDYTNNAKLKESGFAVEGKTVNGFANKSKGAVTLNVQSAKAWESVVGHEITHVLEGTDAYSELRNALYAYAESKGELEGRRAYLNELYQNMDADVEAELTADLVGDYLFTDKDFVSKLTGNRTLFQKIYDEIKYLWNVATGKEKTEIEKVKAEFDRVWKEYSNNNEITEESSESREYGDAAVQYSIREEAPPKETGIAYKVFYVKDGKLYPPMVANPDGADTPMGVWLNADVGTAAPPSKTGRAQVKAGGKGTQGGGGSLAFRPGWHLGDLPRASQFDRVNPETGKKELFPENFVWAEVEYAKDVDYQEEAMSYGYTDNGKFRHAYAGLPRLPENGYYRYRTNPKPDTVPWVITGAMKVNRLLSDAEVNEILEKNGVPAVHRKGGDVGLDKFGFDEKGQVQYSVSDSASKSGVEYDKKSESYSPIQYSISSWDSSDYVTERKKAATDMAKNLGVTEEQAAKYIDDVNSIAKMIADDKERLSYEPSPDRSAFVSNAEYGGSIDFSTICKKRRLFTGTFEAIQNALPNTALTADEVLEIRNMMKDKGYEVSCGLCYVEGSRTNMGLFTKQFIERYKATNPEYVPNMAEMNTATGQEKIRKEHPEVYETYEYFMNHYGRLSPTDKALFASQQKPKMYQMSTDYKGEILDKFDGKKRSVEEKNKNGGLRLQSFSDFEIIHLIDCMQVVMDMSRVGLAGQAYTKVPDFAWALGDTGLKINLSLIAKDVDANGRLVLDEVEGMKESDAMALRDRYSDNVGTIVVVFTDAQLKAAMADERIDYIIPYHRSQWKTSQYESMGLPENTQDYTPWQNESYIEDVFNKNGKKLRPDNYMPNTYWDFNKSGKENAEAYLQMCAENNRKPKFSNMLVDNGDGSYSLQPDGSTDGYWKLLIDFKMYNNDGVGVPQNPVMPDFNMEEAKRMLNEYTGGHAKFPVAKDIVDEFVSKHPDNIAPTPDVQYSISAETDADYMSAVERGDTETAQMMVDEAAKNAGYTRTLYHGTASKFNVFGFGRTGIFTTDNFDMAKTYGNNVMSLYGKEGANVLHIDAKESPHWAIEVSKDVLDFSEYPLMRGKERYSTNDISLIAFREGYDVVVIDNVYDNYSAASGNTENGLGTDVVYKDSNQVKSSEPVTYDDNGNVIPLSQRFNAENVDIRYSLSKEDEESAPVGTPLKELALDGDVAPVGENVARKPPKSVRIASGERSDELLYESLDNYPMQTVEQKIAEKLRATQGEIADNRDLRREAEANYEKQIANLRAKYNSKKNKNTKEASKILQSISRLERLKASVEADFAKRISDLEARAERLNDPKYARAMQKQVKMEADAKWAADLLGDTSTWKDKKIGLQYATNTERRNLRDIVRDANGNVDIAKADAIDDALNGQYNRDEAAKKRELAQVRDKYAKLKITRAEDAYIQMLGEFRHNPDTTLTEKDITEYYEKNKSKIDTAKVDRVIELARQDYDSWLNRVNAELKKQGMKEIPYRQGYFPHFTEPKQNFIQKLLNWKTQDNEIPTSIAGLTEQFKPTKSWQSFDKTRHSDETDYSFMKGFDSYSEGALDWIYHMDTLQKRRAVENHIRFTHSDEGIKARIKEVYANKEMDANEAQAQIEHILAEAKNPLNNFVQDFTTHTNILAGKKNSLDRTVEQWTNRHIYSVMTNVQNRMSANMVLANVRSALTNFIPITQSWAQVSPVRSLQAAKETIANSFKDDGTVDKSAFLTNRLREVDKLYQTTWDKVLDKAGIMFEIVDNFSSQVIWRSKYNQNLANGMTESEAIKNADQFAENVMAGRSKGNEPTLFNAKNPFVKAFTMFQLEVNNQYGYLFKDVPNDLKAETEHWKLNLAKGYTTAFIGAYVYNALLEQVTGSDAALDPIGIVEELLKDLGLFGDDEEEEPDKVVTNLVDNVVEELPFVGGLFGGGRIPISSALPYSDDGLTGFIEDVSEGNWGNVGKEMMNPLLNVGLPVAGGQLKKTYQGLKMFSDDHPVTGSYTDSGKLRFPVEDTPLNRAQAAIFGQYASKNAREYFDNGYAPLNEKQIQEYIDVDMPIKEYREYREGLKKQETLEDKFDYISGLDLPVAKKNILINNVVDRKEDVDLEGYEDFGSLEEFDFATKNPEKYAFAKSVGGYSAYQTYSDALYNIKADKDASGKSINGSRKEKVLNYINNLDADYYTKIILWKSEYPSDDNYNREIVDYINNRSDLSYEDKVAVLAELGFRVTADGQIYSD